MMEQKLVLGRLLRPKKDIVVTKDATDSVEPKRRTKTRKEISKDYRERIKDNPEMLKVHRDSEKKRFKDYYIRRSEEAVERNRQLQRERQQKYRDRCKMQEVGRSVVRKTRQTLGRKSNKVARGKAVTATEYEQTKKECREKTSPRHLCSKEVGFNFISQTIS